MAEVCTERSGSTQEGRPQKKAPVEFLGIMPELGFQGQYSR